MKKWLFATAVRAFIRRVLPRPGGRARQGAAPDRHRPSLQGPCRAGAYYYNAEPASAWPTGRTARPADLPSSTPRRQGRGQGRHPPFLRQVRPRRAGAGQGPDAWPSRNRTPSSRAPSVFKKGTFMVVSAAAGEGGVLHSEDHRRRKGPSDHRLGGFGLPSL